MLSKENNDSAIYFYKFIKEITDRLQANKKNQNWLCAMCGGTGSGKTYSAIALAILLCKSAFNPRIHIVFTPMEFMDLINSDKLKSGDVIIFEEAGVGLNSKEWFTIQNKMLSYVLQTFRHRNIGVIFTMPGLKLVDGTARMLFHCYMEPIEIDYKEETVEVKVLLFSYDSLQDKTYRMYPKYYDEHDNLVTMKSIILRKPPQDIIDIYEERKTAYTKTLNSSILLELKKADVSNEVQADPCKGCKSAYYRFMRKTKSFVCQKCGTERKDNPYIRARSTPSSNI